MKKFCNFIEWWFKPKWGIWLPIVYIPLGVCFLILIILIIYGK